MFGYRCFVHTDEFALFQQDLSTTISRQMLRCALCTGGGGVVSCTELYGFVGGVRGKIQGEGPVPSPVTPQTLLCIAGQSQILSR